MFDFSTNDGQWDDEPTEKEILKLIEEVKEEIIRKYQLITETGTALRMPISFTKCYSVIDKQQNICCLAARKCLETTIFTAKLITPSRYHYLWDDLLENWLPFIS